MPTATISVREVQQGLTYWSDVESRGLTDDAPHPGRADNQWGPRTHEALRAYVAFLAGGTRYDSARVLAPLRSVAARASEIELEQHFVARLQTHAILHRSRSRTPGRTPTPREEPGRVRPPPDRTSSSGNGGGSGAGRGLRSSSSGGSAGPVLAIGAALLGAGAAAFAWSRRSKRSGGEGQSDGEIHDDELLETDWA